MSVAIDPRSFEGRALEALPWGASQTARYALADGARVSSDGASLCGACRAFHRATLLADVPDRHHADLRATGWRPTAVRTAVDGELVERWTWEEPCPMARDRVPRVTDVSEAIDVRAEFARGPHARHDCTLLTRCRACRYDAQETISARQFLGQRDPATVLLRAATGLALKLERGGCVHYRSDNALHRNWLGLAVTTAVQRGLFVARVLNPPRPRFWDALAVVYDVPAAELRENLIEPANAVEGGWPFREFACDGPAEAWELLATRGLIPMDWVDDPRRRFHAFDEVRDVVVHDDGRVTCAGVLGALRAEVDATGVDTRALLASMNDGPTPLRLPHPRAVLAAVLFAADVEDVLRAEALARELTGCDRVVWRVVARPEVRQAPYNHTRADGPYDPCPTCALLGAQWSAANGHAGDSDAAIVAKERARDLLATGYALDDVSDGAAVLVCPLPG